MSFSKMVEGLKERDKEKLLIIGLGAFYIAIGEDAVLLHEKLGLKCTCFKNHICKVGIPRNSIGKYIKEIEKLKYGYILYDMPLRYIFYLKKNIDLNDVKLQKEEVDYVKYMTKEEIEKLIDNEEMLESHGIMFKELMKKRNNLITNAKDYLGKIVTVKIDRALGTKHPKHGFIYTVNYGYIEGTISGDGEELDAYVLGVFEPCTEFTGRVISYIHRTNDNDDKLIVVPDGKEYTDDMIRALTEFQEQYFESVIIR